MKISEKGMKIEKISLKFNNMLSKENVNEALKLLTENISNGILPLTDKTLKMLNQKHPESNEEPQEVLLQRPTRPIHSVRYENMDESNASKVGIWTI